MQYFTKISGDGSAELAMW